MQRNGKRRTRGHLLLALAMIMAMLATACSNGANGSNAPGNDNNTPPTESAQQGDGKQAEADPYEGLPKKVSISMFDRGRVSSDEGTYEDNRWVKWIREQSDIDVSIVPVPRNQSQDSLNVLFASGQAPDLVWEYDRSYIGKLVTQGVIQPIGDYIEKYSTSYKKYLEENPDLLPHLTFDGEIYAVATKRPIIAIANHGMWIRQDWLDELNLEQPTTVEAFIEVAKAFKEHYPDSTPIVGHTSNDIYAAMYGAMNFLWYLEDGKMQYGATVDRFSEVIGLEKQLYELGLVDREYLTDNDNQRSKQLWTTGKAGIYLGQWGNGNVDIMTQDLLTNVPDAKPVPLEMVASPYGKYGAYQESSPNIFVAFNKDMKNPKAAIEYLDWMVDEGWFPLVYGDEGVHYNLVDGVPKRLDDDKFNKEVLYAGEYAVLRQQVVKPEDLLVMAADDELSQKIAKLNAEALKIALKNEFRRDIPYQPSFNEINEIRSTLDTFIRETRATAVTQGEKYDGEWALGEIRKEWERLGGAKAEELAQKWYEENKSGF
ncbi:extracellular solute-binding protein [Paenibacillus sp. J5C_2022]|uniref:extracellular solute-binding protein n=1 Tax=Paenibacillus sp. J5C2022 TaxID=2977129 RepID=UPI0021CE6C66|nr:extracellular solute-binding protein [Paenibacillus sp. J5C2022]MCU6707834.1 extracellular solute-binding protein [Paenibacillus sp. J5C2022]